MARAKMRGGHRTGSRNRDIEHDPKPRQKSRIKKNATISKDENRQQQPDTVDEGIPASPDDIPQSAVVDNDDSTYYSSPHQPSAHVIPVQNTIVQTTPRKNITRSTRSKAFGAAQSVKLQEVLGTPAVPEQKVTLRLPAEKLRTLQQDSSQEGLVSALSPLPYDRSLGGATNMAKVQGKDPHDVLDDHFKDVIQNLYEMASITHGYLPQSHSPLVNKGIDLTRSLAALSDLTADDSAHPAAATIRSILIPPEVIDYVANGRNPDIYTREFMENVQRGNQVLNGKMQAFGRFAEIYAKETKSAIPELADGVDRLMKHSEAFEREDGTGEWKMKKPQANAQ